MGGDSAVVNAAAESKGTGEVNINIRRSDGSKFSVHMSLESTVESLKEDIALKSDISSDQLRLVCKGRVMNNHQTLKSFGLEDDDTVYLTRKRETAATTNPSGGTKSSTNSTGSPGSTKDDLTWLLNNPEQMLNLIMSNPQMREIMEQNPEFARIHNDPDSLRQDLEAQTNPEITREINRIATREINNIESSPGGLELLKSMYEEEQMLDATLEATLDATLMADAGTQGGQASNPSTNFSSTSSEAIARSSSPNTSPLPNPWTSTRGSTSGGNDQSPSLFTQLRQKPVFFNQTPDKTMMQNPEAFQPEHLSQLGQQLSTQESGRATGVQDLIHSNMSPGKRAANMPRAHGSGGPTVPISNCDEPPEQLYATQLSQLQEMGFSDTEENIRALTATAGDVHEAVKRLSEDSGQ